MKRCLSLLLLAGLFQAAHAGSLPRIEISVQRPAREITYALQQLSAVVESRGGLLVHTSTRDPARCRISIESAASSGQANDGYRIRRIGQTLIIDADHDRGAMYAVLDLAREFEQGTAWADLPEREVRAHHPFRAIKFNLPWYSYRAGEHLSLHTETCRDLAYWEAFLDMMVENKFNTLTLWNMHPFIYMVTSPSFPETSPFTDEELAEWQAFWHGLFGLAKDRGIETYVVNWNMFVSEKFAEKYIGANQSESAQFWGDGETSPELEKYTRELVTATIDTYPDLTGLGLTLGERMGGMTSPERRDWIDRTIIAGMREADREARLIYRAPLSAGTDSSGSTSVTTEQLTREAIENLGFTEPVWIEFKFNWSHAHTSPELSIVHGGMLTDTYWEPYSDKYRAVWTMRNEDFFALRWAQPDFIREFIGLNSQPYVGGAIIGSECYIPALDYISKPEVSQGAYAFERQWLFYQVWGELLWDPATPDTTFERALATRFGLESGAALLRAWKLASSNANRLGSFFQGTWDATLYSEGFTTHVPRQPNQLIGIRQFMEHPTLDADYVGIAEFVAGEREFGADDITPLKLAAITEAESTAALNIVAAIRRHNPSPALLVELMDIEAWAWHGRYFADKLRGGVALARYWKEGEADQQEAAVTHLTHALAHWQELVRCVETYNRPVMPYQFDAEFSWRKQLPLVEKDIAVAQAPRP